MFLVLTCLSKKIKDRTILLVGFIMELLAVSWLLYYLPTAKPSMYNTKTLVTHRGWYGYPILKQILLYPKNVRYHHELFNSLYIYIYIYI